MMRLLDLLVVISLLLLCSVGGDEIETEIPWHWKLAYSYTNNQDNPITVQYKVHQGQREINQQSQSTEFVASVGIAGKISAGVGFEIISLAFERSLSLSLTYTTRYSSMSEKEIFQATEITKSHDISPHSEVFVWQAVANVGGHEIDYKHFVIQANDSIPSTDGLKMIARLSRRRRIECGSWVRIKHPERQQYIIMTTRKGWHAATLAYDNNYHFQIECRGNRIFRIVSERYMCYRGNEYKYMYSSDLGGIYFDQSKLHNEKQFWYLSHWQIYEGEAVAFRNKRFSDSTLCYHRGESTDVYCLPRRSDRWILELAPDDYQPKPSCI